MAKLKGRALEKKVEEENRKLHDFGAHNYDNYPPNINRTNTKNYSKDAAYIRGLFRHTPRVLDAGCGTGHLALAFVNAGFHVDVNDISPKMVDVTVGKLRKVQPRFVKYAKDANQLLLDLRRDGVRYDVICFSSMLHHIVDYKKTLRLAAQLLRPGGIVYVYGEPTLSAPTPSRSAKIMIFLVSQYVNAYKAIRNPRHAARFIRENFFTKKDQKQFDVQLAEFHAGAGLDHKGILSLLEKEGCRVIRYVTYRVYPSRLFNVVEPFRDDSDKTFRLIAMKIAH